MRSVVIGLVLAFVIPVSGVAAEAKGIVTNKTLANSIHFLIRSHGVPGGVNGTNGYVTIVNQVLCSTEQGKLGCSILVKGDSEKPVVLDLKNSQNLVSLFRTAGAHEGSGGKALWVRYLNCQLHPKKSTCSFTDML